MINNVPEGFLKDAKGHLVPLELVKPIDMARNDLVLELVAKALVVSKTLADFKTDAFGDIQAFVDMSAEQYNAKTCGDCVHCRRCTIMFGHIPADESCDWSPSRFREAVPATNTSTERLH